MQIAIYYCEIMADNKCSCEFMVDELIRVITIIVSVSSYNIKINMTKCL